MISQSIENYLKTIFSLSYSMDLDVVKINDISKRLTISPAAVSDMIKKLEKMKYVTVLPYKGVSLTEEGRDIGCKMLRRHRLWESYLQTVLDIPWDKVHEEAELLEHACSDYLIDRLDHALGHPKVDPHGNPIPDKNGRIVTYADELTLSSCGVGDDVYILRVVDLGEQFLKYLDSLGLTLNSRLLVEQVLDFDQSLLCKFKDKTITLSKQVSDQIFVIKTS